MTAIISRSNNGYEAMLSKDIFDLRERRKYLGNYSHIDARFELDGHKTKMSETLDILVKPAHHHPSVTIFLESIPP